MDHVRPRVDLGATTSRGTLGELAAEVVERVAAVASSRGVILALILRELATIELDAARLRLALENLVISVLEGTPARGVLELEVGTSRGERACAFVSIHDRRRGAPSPTWSSTIDRIVREHGGWLDTHRDTALGRTSTIYVPLRGATITG